MSLTTPATTYLFVPGNRPERFAKALASGADRVIIDLEDAVAPADKDEARRCVSQGLLDLFAQQPEETSRQALDRLVLRINDGATPWYAGDLTLAKESRFACIMLPKCESASQIADLRLNLDTSTKVLALVESARGMLALKDIALAPGVERLAFGSLDYMVDLELPSDSLALDFAAVQMALVSRAAGLACPLAGVTPDLDPARVQADMAHARSLGLLAKMCIHPSQIAAVKAALAPSAEELAWAQRVLALQATHGSSAFQMDGKMVDRPVLLKAERIVALATHS